MAGTLVFVPLSPDFVAPGEGGPGGEDTDSPVWGMSIEDLVDYLEAKGLWSREDMLPIAAGVATEAYVCNGAEIYWWDVDNLEEGSNEAAAYQDIVNGDPINLYQQGQSYMPVTRNGPFAIFTGAYNGDVDVILDAFTSFGQEDGGEADDRSDPVWDMTLDDLAAYMADQGAVDANDYVSINYGEDGEGMLGYRFGGNIDLVHYDLDTVSESYAQEYEMLAETGMITYVNGETGYFTVNGPFTLHFYEWGDETVPEERQAEIIEIFESFGH